MMAMRGGIRVLAAALMLGAAGIAAAADVKPVLRPQVEKPLQEANTLIANKSYADALGRIAAAEQTGQLTPYEIYAVNHLRGLAAIGLNDTPAAIGAFDAVLRSGYTPDPEKQQTLEVLVKLSFSSKDFPKAIDYVQQYEAGGGAKPEILAVLPQAYFLNGQYAQAAKAVQAQILKQRSAGQKPAEAQLQLLATCALKQNDEAGYIAGLEQLARWYPTRDYWQKLIARRLPTPDYWDPAALDIDRLRFATDTLQSADDYLFAAQRALQAGLPGEAQQYLNAGYARKALGQGDAAGRQARLADRIKRQLLADQQERERAEREAAAQVSGDALVLAGLQRVSLQQYEPGLSLIEKGIAKDRLHNPEQARLHLAYAQLQAGRKEQAAASLRALRASGITQDLAQLWLLRTE